MLDTMGMLNHVFRSRRVDGILFMPLMVKYIFGGLTMKKMQYQVIHTIGNSERRIMSFATKHAAIVFGKQYFDNLVPGGGTVTIEGVIAGDPQRRFFGGWHF